MKRLRSFLILCIVHCALCIPLPCISQSPEQFGGIYYAYPVQKDSIPDAPDGFEPVYISHYGRHGSRWPVNPKAYRVTADFFQNQHLAQNLTDDGRAAWKLATLCAGNAQGHLGELTPLGERQHREIAARMASRFPSLFKEGRKVVARSSVEPRCIMSMAAFCESLKDINPRLDIRRHATPGDMAFIHPKTEEASLMNSDDAPWRWEFDGFRDSVALCPGLNTRLFKKYPDSDSISGFSRALYDIAISVQNIDSLDADLFTLFSPEELKGLWTAANYIQYVGNARSPLSGNTGPECVRPLLNEIIARADEMLDSGEVSVDLRFGHDTDLLRLVSLLGINGNGIESENPWEVAEKWRNFDISPMGANLQLIFYRNKEGEILVHPRLNEFPAIIPSLTPVAPGFYSWQSLKSLIPNP